MERLINETPGMSVLADLDLEVVASDRDFNYRQRMDFIASPDAYGQRKDDGSREIIDLKQCHLIEDQNFETFMLVKKHVSDLGIEAYDLKENIGELRYVTVRRTRSNEQLVALLTSADADESKLDLLGEKLLAAGVDSVYWNINSSRTDDVIGATKKYWGKQYITEEMLNRKFILGPITFFQANHFVASAAYSAIRNFVKKCEPRKIHDLYSGTCTMPIVFADLAESVVAVENFPENVQMAHRNLVNNGIKNVDIIEQDVAEFLKRQDIDMEFSVLNPPRKGMHEQALRRILELKPQNLTYLSCSPRSLLEDLGILFRDYKPTKIQIYDMFPQTEHFETLVLLTRKA
jgi:23S rRNA (uracil-5-)-methyltransferase RumA